MAIVAADEEIVGRCEVRKPGQEISLLPLIASSPAFCPELNNESSVFYRNRSLAD